jgi:predicted transcriptional regulator
MTVSPSAMPHTHGPIKPTPAELELLRLLWALGPGTAKQVHAAMKHERPQATHATVLRQLQIMHGKGLLTRDESQRSHVYAAAQAQGPLQMALLRELIRNAFSGSGKALIMAALRNHVSDAERAEIQGFLEELRDRTGIDPAVAEALSSPAPRR